MAYIGSRVKRQEDIRLLRGTGKYVGDIHRAGMMHAVVLRSPHAHARIVKVDARRALQLPGIIGVLTAADIPALQTIPMRTGILPGMDRSQQFPIATNQSALRRRAGRTGRGREPVPCRRRDGSHRC